MIKALKEAEGYVNKAAELLNVSRTYFYNKMKEYVTVQEALDEIREGRHDKVELALMKKIARGDTACIIFYLKTQCKQRGYIERQEIEHAGSVGFRVVEDGK